MATLLGKEKQYRLEDINLERMVSINYSEATLQNNFLIVMSYLKELQLTVDSNSQQILENNEQIKVSCMPTTLPSNCSTTWRTTRSRRRSTSWTPP